MKKKSILWAVLLALLAMLFSYVSTNITMTFFGERDTLKFWNAFKTFVIQKLENANIVKHSEGYIPDNVLFIDVSGDNQLIDIKDDYGIPVGNSVITDRNKLLELLARLKSSGDYAYVMMDVFFEEGYATDVDSALFGLIASMDKIVIPCHSNGQLASTVLEEKAAYASYDSNLYEDDFSKYPIWEKSGLSMPLKMYSDLTGRSVTRHGFLYLEGAYVSRRSVFPKMYVQIEKNTRGRSDSNGPEGSKSHEKPFLSLGADILAYDPEVVDFENKIVVIGNFETDIHRSYAGEIPGAVINYNVYESLRRGQHRIPYVLILIYFLLFFTMSFFLLNGTTGENQPSGWVWAKLFVIYSVILTIVCIFVFEIWGQAHDIFITSTLFSIVDTCYKLNRKNKKNA